MEIAILIIGIGAVALFYPIYLATRTGEQALDRLRFAATTGVVRAWGVDAKEEYGRAMMAILRNESGGNPSHYVGDVSSPGGPSIGPWQVWRQTAKDLGLWKPPAGVVTEEDERLAYANLAQGEFTNALWAARVLKTKWDAAGGDLADAIRRYNGSGSAANEYRNKAVAWMNAIWGGKAGV